MGKWQSETQDEKLARLRGEVEQVQRNLIEAEADLADRQAEINAFEFEFEARVGYLLDKLSALDDQITQYNDLIETVRNRAIFGNAYLSVEKQYRRAWSKPSRDVPLPPPQPVSPVTEAEIKKLYRKLARQFHPDLAADEPDRLFRTEKMAALNDAYAARSLPELRHLAQEAAYIQTRSAGQTARELVQVLEEELARCRRRLREIQAERRTLEDRPSVKLHLEVNLARRRGEDLLAQTAQDLERQVGRKTAERDLLKAQVDQLGPDQGIIPINR